MLMLFCLWWGVACTFFGVDLSSGSSFDFLRLSLGAKGLGLIFLGSVGLAFLGWWYKSFRIRRGWLLVQLGLWAYYSVIYSQTETDLLRRGNLYIFTFIGLWVYWRVGYKHSEVQYPL